MKKKLLALVALLSFYQAFVKPALAQQAHEPPTQPTEIKGGSSVVTTPRQQAQTEIKSPKISIQNDTDSNVTLYYTGNGLNDSMIAQSYGRREPAHSSWRGAQWGLFLLGIVSTFILTLIAPKATKQATDTVVAESGRSLVVGLIAGLLAISVLLVNAALVNSPFGLLYAPLGAVVALVPLAVLVAGWLCGMRLVGDWVAQRFGQPMEGSLFARIVLGLGLFWLIKLIVGGSMLGSATLFFEGVIALLGTGALLITGFGARPDWLGARLRGESRWFGGKRF